MKATTTESAYSVSTWLLAFGQAIHLTCAVMMVTVAALAASKLAPSEALVTLPYGAQFASVMALSYPVSMLMRRFGRRRVFIGATFALMAAGVVGFIALEQGSFTLLTAAHILVGAYAACANFYRFAAVDDLPATAKSTAMSLVISGGVFAAVAGPVLASTFSDVSGFKAYAAVYACLIALGLANWIVVASWSPLDWRWQSLTPRRLRPRGDAGRTRRLQHPRRCFH